MYKVQVETEILNEFRDMPERFEKYEDAEAFAGMLFDEGIEGDFVIRDVEWNRPLRIQGHKLVKTECPICGKETRLLNMMMTRDCHGIPYRAVCPKCYWDVMESVGYDGEYYTEADECLDYDY